MVVVVVVGLLLKDLLSSDRLVSLLCLAAPARPWAIFLPPDKLPLLPMSGSSLHANEDQYLKMKAKILISFSPQVKLM